MSLFRTLALTLCVASGAIATPALARPGHETARPARPASEIARPSQEIARPARPASEIARIAWDDRPRDQDRAFRNAQEGRSMPLPMIEQRVIPRMGGANYLGPEMRGSNVRMKFLDRGKVIWVDVDPRTGRILGKSGD